VAAASGAAALLTAAALLAHASGRRVALPGAPRDLSAWPEHRAPPTRAATEPEFGPDDPARVGDAATPAAVALERARLFSLEQRRQAQLETLAAVERELAAELHTERLLDLVIERASGLLHAEGTVLLLDNGGLLSPQAWFGLGAWLREVRIPIGAGLAGMVARDRRGRIVNEYPASPLALAEFVSHGVSRVMAQPLVVRDRLLGVVTLTRGPGSEPFTEGDLATFETFALQAAIALDNARLYREARRYGEHLEALDVVNRQVASSLQFEEVLGNVAAATARLVEAPYVTVWVADPVRPEAETLRTSLAAQAAVALEHARLYADTTTRLHETRALLEVSQIFNSTLEARPMLEQAAMKIAQVCQVDRCTIERWANGRTVPVMSQFADGRRAPEMWRRFVADPEHESEAHARAVATRAPVVIDDAAAGDLGQRE